MKTLAIMLISMLACTPSWGHSNFAGNPDLPYPPACAGAPGPEPVALGDPVQILLWDDFSHAKIGFLLQGFRQACTEDGRSLVWLHITAQPHHRYQYFSVALPTAWVRPPGYEYDLLMRLVTGPNGWGSGSDANFNEIRLEGGPRDTARPNQGSWIFLLDSPSAGNYYDFPFLSADQYNESFTLKLRAYGDSNILATLQVPATRNLLQSAPGLPISGRLAGTWVVDGAPDQGFVLSISNILASGSDADFVRDTQRLRVFLAQYTYDAEGEPLWLTGSTTIPTGATSAAMAIELVSGGEFMGSVPAQHQVIGTVRINAHSCDDLEFEYDYSGLGLGDGTKRLQRVFSLETAGHECRDFAARVAANR